MYTVQTWVSSCESMAADHSHTELIVVCTLRAFPSHRHHCGSCSVTINEGQSLTALLQGGGKMGRGVRGREEESEGGGNDYSSFVRVMWPVPPGHIIIVNTAAGILWKMLKRDYVMSLKLVIETLMSCQPWSTSSVASACTCMCTRMCTCMYVQTSTCVHLVESESLCYGQFEPHPVLNATHIHTLLQAVHSCRAKTRVWDG